MTPNLTCFRITDDTQNVCDDVPHVQPTTMRMAIRIGNVMLTTCCKCVRYTVVIIIEAPNIHVTNPPALPS